MSRLFLSETFGPTLQGEGPSQGRACFFVRLGLCNLTCSWCDTPYTWDWTGRNGIAYDKAAELTATDVDALVASLLRLTSGPVRRVVVTGGEPFVQMTGLAQLVAALTGTGVDVEIETNGTIAPSDDLLACHGTGRLHVNCSPKLANSGVAYDDRVKPDALRALAGLDTSYKFVVTDRRDLDEIDDLVSAIGCAPDRVYLMPEGRSAAAITEALPRLFSVAAERGWNLSPRLHVLAFDDKRGI